MAASSGLRVMAPGARVMVANRGEIACRVLKTAKDMGLPTAAVYTDPDAGARHVKEADVAVRLPGGVGGYIDVEAVIRACRDVGAGGVHPGYGFLSERAAFAERLYDSEIAFIGPPASAIDAMGDKARSKQIMAAAGVPVVPGYEGEGQSLETLWSEAKKIGFPLMIKAVLGGGGKGMRAVFKESEFEDALSSAQREAKGAFGDDRMLLERLVSDPRHVEVQVFCDMHGNAVHLFERDCSVQRRHQKVLEEAPAPGVDENFRAMIGKSAVDAALAVGYVGAGTVEFIVDGKTGEYYFMEMNTRLQVEHPVTELVTGTDLVSWQLKVAQGMRLPVTSQSDLALNGHAIEARLYAEAPDRGFLPSAGFLHRWRMPNPTGELRSDTGYGEGDVVSPYYDAMLAKLIVWGPDRQTALMRMRSALQRTQISGPSTNVDYVKRILKTEEFMRGGVTTAFIEENASALYPRDATADPAAAASRVHPSALAALAAHLGGSSSAGSRGRAGDSGAFTVPSRSAVPFRMTGISWETTCVMRAAHGGGDERLKVKMGRAGDGSPWTVSVAPTAEGKDSAAPETLYSLSSVELVADESGEGHSLRVRSEDGATFTVPFVAYTPDGGDAADTKVHMWDADYEHQWSVIAAGSGEDGGVGGVGGGGSVRSPMPGKIVKVMVGEGDEVKEGDVLLVLEAMKMEHALKSMATGKVESIRAKVGDQVADGAVLAVVTQG